MTGTYVGYTIRFTVATSPMCTLKNRFNIFFIYLKLDTQMDSTKPRSGWKKQGWEPCSTLVLAAISFGRSFFS